MKNKYLFTLSILTVFAVAYCYPQNNSLNFSVDKEKITIPSADFAPPWTVETWMYKDGAGVGPYQYLASGGGGFSSGLRIEQASTKEIGVTVGFTNHSFGYTAVTGEWSHIAITCDGTDMFLYVDGEQEGTINSSINAPMGVIGNFPFNGHFIGQLDEYRVWNKALTSAQIEAMMTQEIEQNVTAVRGSDDGLDVSGLNWADLVLYYKFNESSGDIATDSSSTGDDGVGDDIDNDDWIGANLPVTWNGSVDGDWDDPDNWNLRGGTIPPSSAQDIVINSGVSNNLELTGSKTVESVLINDGGVLNVESDASLTVSGNTIINGAEALVLKSDASGTASFIDEGTITYENSGTVKVERYIPLSVGNGAYHYIGTPIDAHAKFSDMTDLYAYRESDLSWLAHDDLTDGFTTYNNAKGYAIRYTAIKTKSFTGEINNASYTVPVTSTNHGGDVYEHFNLVANPYASSISAATFVTENSSLISNNLYFWNGLDYSTYNTSLGSGTAGATGATPDDDIAVGQAFFVDATSSGNVSFTRAMRGASSDNFYRKTSFPQLRLLLTSGAEKSDLLLTGHPNSSKNIDEYDAKQLTGNAALSLGSLLNERAYDIESVPELSGHSFALIVTANEARTITFHLENLKDLEGNQVYLEDKEEGTITDITENSYTTQVRAGEDRNRFKLGIAKLESDYDVWVNDGIVTIFKNGKSVQGKVTLIGLDGRILSVSNSTSINNWSILPSGVYLLKFDNGTEQEISKIIKL